MLLVIIIMVIYVVLTCRSLWTTGGSPTLLLKFFNAECCAKGISSICWRSKAANQSSALKYIRSVQKQPVRVQLSIMWPHVPWASSFSPAADPLRCTFVFAVKLWHQRTAFWFRHKGNCYLFRLLGYKVYSCQSQSNAELRRGERG